ncbi:MAG: LysM peptidoglycan-binding domain-containing protein [Candidatus Hydrogenedentes bacterium]|nr:LysM peptidoglycan-binding domain-containing protein [Candidatus Hydrogenedentota bacterium]
MLIFKIIIISFLATTENPQTPFNVYFPPKNLPPISYTDEILPICVVGPPSTSFTLQILIKNSKDEVIHGFTPEKPMTQANSIYCCEISNFPPLRGFFTAEVTISNKNISNNWKIPFCRLERFSPGNRSFFSLRNPDPKLIPLFKLYWFDELVFPAEHPQLKDLVQSSISQGYKVSLDFDPNKFQSSLDALEHIYSQVGSYVTEWNFKIPQDKSLLNKLLQIITTNSRSSKVTLSLDTIESLPFIETLTANAQYPDINWCGSLELNEIKNLIEKFIEIRNESPEISVSITENNFPSATPEQFQKIWELLTLKPVKIKLPYHLIFQEKSPSPLLPFIIGISRLWNNEFEFVGWYKNEITSKACVFSTPGNWLLVFWGDQPLSVRGETLATTQGFDIFTNPSALPTLTNGTLTVDSKNIPSYLTGNCYEVIAESAQNSLKTLSEKMLSIDLSNTLPPAEIENIKAITQNPRELQNRVRMLSLIRFIPTTERYIITDPNWNKTGALFTYYLYDFLRKSCILEQVKTEPFREPFLDIKTRCEEHITIFLTGSSTNMETDKRANLIMKEVNKILELADKASTNGKRIEATALLYLAEGLALSLIEHLKTTPLMLAENKGPKQNQSPDSQDTSSPVSNSQVSEKLPKDKSKSDSLYTVTPGDTPEKIAKKFGVPTKELLLANNLTEKSVIRVGQKIKIPTKDVTGEIQSPQIIEKASNQPEEKDVVTEFTQKNEEKAEQPKEDSQPSDVIIYKIQPGDTPATIAKKFNLTPEVLMKFNNITDPTKLRVGQELRIPTSEPKSSEKTSPEPEEKKQPKTDSETTTAPQKEEDIIHIVQKGDNPYTLSKKYGVPIEEILKANNLTSKSILQIGQKLTIPKARKQE